MDFLDSLDLETTNKRSDRVRSWYMYEQFKSLERNQLQAAQKLKDRSYQERILRQELSERRARRKIYDQFGLSHSESRLERDINSTRIKTELSVSADDCFESVCELQEDEELAEEKLLSEDTFSEDDSIGVKCYTDEFKSVKDTKDGSYDESVTSVMKNLNNDENLSDDLKKIIKTETNIAQNINLQLEEVKENIQCIEKYTELVNDNILEDDITPIDDLSEELKSKKVLTEKTSKEFDSNLFIVWTKLVSFAYQLLQLNHGRILQPYVSPVKYATDESDVSVESIKNVNRKKPAQLKKSRKSNGKKFHIRHKSEYKNTKRSNFNRTFRSEECWRRYSKDTFGGSNKKCKHASEPWRSGSKLYTIKREASEKSSTSSSIWPEFSKEDISRSNCLKVCDCCWRRDVENSILKITRYVDSMLKELEECSRK